jgi:hypothetical protein
MINLISSPRLSSLSFLYRDLLTTIGSCYSDIVHLNYQGNSIIDLVYANERKNNGCYC